MIKAKKRSVKINGDIDNVIDEFFYIAQGVVDAINEKFPSRERNIQFIKDIVNVACMTGDEAMKKRNEILSQGGSENVR